MKLQLIRNATIKLRYGNKTILIDPYFADPFTQPSLTGKIGNPLNALPLRISDILEGVDLIIVSHLHPDHFDEEAHKSIPKDMKLLCQPSDLHAIQKLGFENVEAIHNSLLWEGMEIVRTPGQHGAGEILKFTGLVSGFVFKQVQEPVLYWIDDSIWYDEIKGVIDTYTPDVIICHAGGNILPMADTTYIIMDKVQALELANYAKGSTIIATHIGALDHGYETRESLREYLNLHHISQAKFLIPLDGDDISF